MAITFKCPDCGAPITDDPNLSVLECKHCGNSVTKYVQNTTKIEMNVTDRKVFEDKTKIEETKTERIIMVSLISFLVFLFILLEIGK